MGKAASFTGFLRLDLCNAPTGGVRPDVGEGGSTTRKVDGSYGKPETTKGFINPKVDVQAWPLSNMTVQEDLLLRRRGRRLSVISLRLDNVQGVPQRNNEVEMN